MATRLFLVLLAGGPGSGNARGSRFVPWPTSLAAAALLAQALVAIGTAVGYAVRLVQGVSADASMSVGFAVLFALIGVGLWMVSRGLWRGATWPRTPAVVWSLLLLPVGVSLLQSEQNWLGVAALTVGLAGAIGVPAGARDRSIR